MSELVTEVRKLMGDAYPEIAGPGGAHVRKVIAAEEQRFTNTLDMGMKKLDEDLLPLASLQGTAEAKEAVYSGEASF